MTLYNLRTEGRLIRVTKFSDDVEFQGVYYLTPGYSGKFYCNCPQGRRETCRHRKMYDAFRSAGYIDTEYFLDFDKWRWALPIRKD